MVSTDEVRALALRLPRTTETLVNDEVRFRAGRIVYLGFSPDETLMGFAFPREEREPLIASDPAKFLLPRPSQRRWNWTVVRLAAIDAEEMGDLVLGAWEMAVPRRVARQLRG